MPETKKLQITITDQSILPFPLLFFPTILFPTYYAQYFAYHQLICL